MLVRTIASLLSLILVCSACSVDATQVATTIQSTALPTTATTSGVDTVSTDLAVSAQTTGDEDDATASPAALWDGLVVSRYQAVTEPGVQLADFAAIVNGRCLGLVMDDQLETVLRLRAQTAEAVRGFGDDECSQHASGIGGSPATGAGTWDEAIDIRFGRAITWGTSSAFAQRARAMCLGSEQHSVTLDPSLSASAVEELLGLKNSDECELSQAGETGASSDATGATPSDGTVSGNVPEGRIIFVSDRDGDYDLYAVNTDGTLFGAITNNDVDDGSWLQGADLSPDRTQIAFAREMPDRPDEIFLIDIRGLNERQITDNQYRDSQPVWPDHDLALAVHRVTDVREAIFFIGANGAGDEMLTDEAAGASFDIDTKLAPWANSDDSALVFKRFMPDGSQQVLMRHLVDETVETIHQSQGLGTIAVSPDGRHLVFGERVERFGDEGSLFVIDLQAEDRTPKQITSLDGSEDRPIWSPDGTKIAFVDEAADGAPSLYVMNADGTNMVRLSPDGHYVSNMRWAPTSDALVLSYYGSGVQEETLAIVDTTGTLFAPIDQVGDPIGWA